VSCPKKYLKPEPASEGGLAGLAGFFSLFGRGWSLSVLWSLRWCALVAGAAVAADVAEVDCV
jgi:hypothetical protein